MATKTKTTKTKARCGMCRRPVSRLERQVERSACCDASVRWPLPADWTCGCGGPIDGLECEQCGRLYYA